VVRESLHLVDAQSWSAELDEVMDKLVGFVVRDALGWLLASGFEAAFGFQ